MISTIQILVLLLAVVAAVAVLAARLKIPPAILLVLTGVVLALVPGLPTLELAPELVLLLVLPPVIYASAVAMSWREFQFNLRPITLLAVGCVVFATVAVAAASHWVLNLAWPVGFVLGAIVSPPDAMAPLSIARRMQLPRRILVILEGEGLANDATALILYRFAVATVSAGVFSLGQAAGMFAVIVIGEILWGIGVGWLTLRLRRWVHDPRIEITLSILVPFLAYWPPEHLGGSGVLATVTAGLYISWNGLRLISAATRLQGIFFWDFLIYLIEGMVFLITGLQARTLIARIGDHSISELAISAAVVSAVVIATRFVWMYPATYLPRWLFPPLKRRDPSPPWQWPFVLAFTGVRGIVSLAAALAIPFATTNGQPFPDRDLILFRTFSVILVTLVGQGLLLPAVIRALGLAHAGRLERHSDNVDEHKARRQGIEAAIARLDQIASERNLCLPDPDGRRLGFPLAGAFTSDGRYEPTHQGILLTCTGGAEGKCIRFGYKPWGFGPNNISLASYYQACVRLVRADYCGDGIGHTRDGTPIDIFDAIGIQRDEPAPGMTFEAAWRADGAVCVRRTRLPDALDSAAVAANCPRLAHSIGETCDEAASALLYNRSFSH